MVKVKMVEDKMVVEMVAGMVVAKTEVVKVLEMVEKVKEVVMVVLEMVEEVNAVRVARVVGVKIGLIFLHSSRELVQIQPYHCLDVSPRRQTEQRHPRQ